MKKKDVSIIIVNWNAGVLLKNCIESIIRYTDGISYEIIIVDNASRKESLICIREFENIDLEDFYLLDALKSSLDKFEDIKKDIEKQAANLIESFMNIMSKELRNRCIWIDWNPARESLTSALLKQVVTAR